MHATHRYNTRSKDLFTANLAADNTDPACMLLLCAQQTRGAGQHTRQSRWSRIYHVQHAYAAAPSPVVTSTPSVSKFSGWPGVTDCHCLKCLQSSSCKDPSKQQSETGCSGHITARKVCWHGLHTFVQNHRKQKRNRAYVGNQIPPRKKGNSSHRQRSLPTDHQHTCDLQHNNFCYSPA